jgi:hypothetical protein
MSKHDPRKPVRAYHRLMMEMLSALKPKSQPRPEQLDLVARVFRKAGGSWVGLYQGSIDDVLLLRKCLKVALKKGFIDKRPDWSK